MKPNDLLGEVTFDKYDKDVDEKEKEEEKKKKTIAFKATDTSGLGRVGRGPIN
jgi:hypothetical protein